MQDEEQDEQRESDDPKHFHTQRGMPAFKRRSGPAAAFLKVGCPWGGRVAVDPLPLAPLSVATIFVGSAR